MFGEHNKKTKKTSIHVNTHGHKHVKDIIWAKVSRKERTMIKTIKKVFEKYSALTKQILWINVFLDTISSQEVYTLFVQNMPIRKIEWILNDFILFIYKWITKQI